MFGKIVMGIPAEAFEDKLDEYKERKGDGASDTDLDADDLKSLLGDFRAIYKEHVGSQFPQAEAYETGKVLASNPCTGCPSQGGTGA